MSLDPISICSGCGENQSTTGCLCPPEADAEEARTWSISDAAMDEVYGCEPLPPLVPLNDLEA